MDSVFIYTHLNAPSNVPIPEICSGHKSVSPAPPISLIQSYAKHVGIRLISRTAIYWQFITIKRGKNAIVQLKLFIYFHVFQIYNVLCLLENNMRYRLNCHIEKCANTNLTICSWNLVAFPRVTFTIRICSDARARAQPIGVYSSSVRLISS